MMYIRIVFISCLIIVTHKASSQPLTENILHRRQLDSIQSLLLRDSLNFTSKEITQVFFLRAAYLRELEVIASGNASDSKQFADQLLMLRDSHQKEIEAVLGQSKYHKYKTLIQKRFNSERVKNRRRAFGN